MDHQTRIDLTTMILDLRLASLTPSEDVGKRLDAGRLRDIAMVLEEMLDRDTPLAPTLTTRPANDTGVPPRIVAGLSWHR
ncbi:hypothetical protein [Aureimonas sp. AU4]|uniref:hypothetical protein n=1 Tax=Aureimonas sp. AU4 TaxID=1638163 RepID=UPI000780310C|nr:hypothetical protein [Aureimonas sp. AU4]